MRTLFVGTLVALLIHMDTTTYAGIVAGSKHWTDDPQSGSGGFDWEDAASDTENFDWNVGPPAADHPSTNWNVTIEVTPPDELTPFFLVYCYRKHEKSDFAPGHQHMVKGEGEDEEYEVFLSDLNSLTVDGDPFELPRIATFHEEHEDFMDVEIRIIGDNTWRVDVEVQHFPGYFVPEPSSLILLAFGCAGAGVIRRKMHPKHRRS